MKDFIVYDCITIILLSLWFLLYDLHHENGSPLVNVRTVLNDGWNAYRNATDRCYVAHLDGNKCGPEEDMWANLINK